MALIYSSCQSRHPVTSAQSKSRLGNKLHVQLQLNHLEQAPQQRWGKEVEDLFPPLHHHKNALQHRIYFRLQCTPCRILVHSG